MDPDLLLIFGFVLVAAMIVFAFAMLTHRRVTSHEERKLELIARAEEARAAQGSTDNTVFASFEKRLRVLERIATDRGQDVAAQIEALRSDRIANGESDVSIEHLRDRTEVN